MTQRHVGRMHYIRPAALFVSLVVSGAMLSGCGSGASNTGSSSSAEGSSSSASASDNAELQSLYQAAKDAGETSVNIYQAANPVFEPLRQAFDKAFPGITANGVSIIGAEAQARLRGEFTSGNHQADLVQSGLSDVIPESGENWFETYTPKTADAVPKESVQPTYTESSLQVYGFVYNTQQVQESDVPKSWDDLLNATKFTGKIGLGDPLASNGSTQAIMALMYNKVWDMSSLQKLHALQPKSYDAAAGLVSAVASGQVAIGLLSPYDAFKTAHDKGAPIGFSGALKEGNPVLPLATALVKEAPHPNAAKLYYSWLFSPEAQGLIASTVGQYGTVPGTPSPSGAPALSDIKQQRLPGPDQFTQVFQQVLSETKQVFQ